MGSTRTTIVHGGLDAAELRAKGIDPTKAIDFSASLNPLGPPPGLRAAIAKVDIEHYPDPHSAEFVCALSKHLAFPYDHILPGNGSSELIRLVTQAYLSQGKTACIFTPTFGEYEGACKVVGARIVQISADERHDFSWDSKQAQVLIKRAKPELVFLCNPNNPTGGSVSRAFVDSIVEALPAAALLVLDEAYIAYAKGAWDARPLARSGKVAVVRSMTKDYGIAGIRLGYLLAAPAIVERLRRYQPSWSVSSVAQVAGLFALKSPKHLSAARAMVKRSKDYLLKEMAALRLPVVPSNANFLLVKVGNAGEVREKLLRRGLIIRDCASFGLPAYIRIGIRKPAECRRLVEGLKEIIGNE